MSDGLVSVIVPCFNKADYVAETLDSVFAQDGVPIEVIVVDDCSTDDSWAIISEYANRASIHRLPQNSGSTWTRNFGAGIARGDYLMFLDADDVLMPGTLRALHAAHTGREGAITACPWKKLERSGGGWQARQHVKPLAPPGGDCVRAWLGGWYYPPCAVLWSRAAFERSGGWGEMGPWDDADIMMQSFLRGVQLVVASGGEALYRILDEGASLRSLPTEPAVRSRIRVLDNVARSAEERGMLPQYRDSLGAAYYNLSRTFAREHPHLVRECFDKVDLYRGRSPIGGSRLHRLAWKLLGLPRKERIAARLDRIRWARARRGP